MRIRRTFLAVLLCLAAAPVLRADAPTIPVTAQEMYSVAQLREAQRVALAQGKPIGFLLTWPMYFPGAPDFHRNSSTSTTYFYRAFKDQAVLVNVNHATGELDHLPAVALDAFHSPAEGGYAPCLCLTNPTFTRLIGIIPLWENPAQREEYFARYHALIADKSGWWDASAVQTAAHATPVAASTPRPAATSPTAVSSGFARELELTRQAEQSTQTTSPSPKP